MKQAETVDEYISQAPKDLQTKLGELRKTIKEAAPNSEEGISYKMPYYHYKGRLVYFQLWKTHIGLYAIRTSIIKKYKKDLKPFVKSKGTIRFPADEKLPLTLIENLVKAQVKLIDDLEREK
jgi:uncharacterized protein YdhG (YjbR/CyaY superfamily)